jgi:hypothetical protein
MSSYRSIHVGPYVRCKVEMVEREIDFRSCPTPTCVDYEHGRILIGGYCEFCGGKIVDRKKIVAVPSVDDDAVRQAIGEELTMTPQGSRRALALAEELRARRREDSHLGYVRRESGCWFAR